MDNENKADRKKILAAIIDDFDKKQSDQRVLEEQALRKKHRQNTAGKVFRVSGVCLMAILVSYLSMSLLGKKVYVKKTYPWAVGIRASRGYLLDDCLFHMWLVRRAFDLFYTQHNDLPLETEALYNEGFLTQKIVCPATGARYIMKHGPHGYIFCCPNPAEHGVKEIWAAVAVGSPVIERE